MRVRPATEEKLASSSSGTPRLEVERPLSLLKPNKTKYLGSILARGTNTPGVFVSSKNQTQVNNWMMNVRVRRCRTKKIGLATGPEQITYPESSQSTPKALAANRTGRSATARQGGGRPATASSSPVMAGPRQKRRAQYSLLRMSSFFSLKTIVQPSRSLHCMTYVSTSTSG